MPGLEWKRVGDAYQFDCGNSLTVEIDRLSESGDSLSGEMTIYDHSVIDGGLLLSARINLMAAQTRGGLARTLATTRDTLDEKGWLRLLERIIYVTKEEYRRGEADVDLWQVPERTQSRWLLEPYVEDGGITVLYADGGSGKSLFGLAIGLSVQSGQAVVGKLHGPPRPVLYLDWEAGADTHGERLQALCAGGSLEPTALQGRAFRYKRMVGSLHESAAAVRRLIDQHSVGFVIVDSMGMARAGEAKDVDPTIKLFTAARSFGCAVLIIDHISKESLKNASADKPFGSIYTHNEARNTWLLERAQEEDERVTHIMLTHKKCNNGRLQKRRSYEVIFDSDSDEILRSVHYQIIDACDVPQLADRLPLGQRIVAELRHGRMNLDAIVEAVDRPREQVKSRLTELKKRGEVFNAAGAWGLSGARYEQ